MKTIFEESIQRLNKVNKDAAIQYSCDCFVTSEVAHSQILQKIGRREATNDKMLTEGAYVGVGPCQNFTYMGHFQSACGFIVDGRIDNFLEHLIFKSTFFLEESAQGYLARLFGRMIPPWLLEEMQIKQFDLVTFLDHCPISLTLQKTFLSDLKLQLRDWGLSQELIIRCGEKLQVFFDRQLSITSVSADALGFLNRIPSYREVLRATTCQDLNYHGFANEKSYSWVRKLQQEDKIVPMLSDICSKQAQEQLCKALEKSGVKVSCIYLSNLEEFLIERYRIEADHSITEPNPTGELVGKYLTRYNELVSVLKAIPTTEDCMLIRFFFPGTVRGRRLGEHPWLEAHITFFDMYLETISRLEGSSLMESYL